VLIAIIGGLSMIFKETTIVVRMCIIIGTIYAMPYLIAMARSKPVAVQEVAKEVVKEEIRKEVAQPKASLIKEPMRRDPRPVNELDAFYGPL
jgi:hypothetical protein